MTHDIIMDESDEILYLRRRVKELETEVSLLRGSLPSTPFVPKLVLDYMVEDDDDPEKKVSIEKDLSGRIIFSLNEIAPGWREDDAYEIGFYCGPETKDESLEDTYDCDLYAQLEKLLADFQPDIGAAENFHTVNAVDQVDAIQRWDEIKKLLLAAGAVERKS